MNEKQPSLRDTLIEQINPLFPKLSFEKCIYSLDIHIFAATGRGERLGTITYEMLRDEMNNEITSICEEATHE